MSHAAGRQAEPALAADAFGVDRRAALERPVGLRLGGAARAPSSRGTASGGPLRSDNGDLTWDAERGLVIIRTQRSKGFIGFIGGKPLDLGGVVLTARPNSQNWAAITLTEMIGDGFGSPGRILVTGTGYAQNTGMRWKDPEHTSVGRDWGGPPSLVEGIDAALALPVAAGRVRAWALDERGQRRETVPVREQDGKAALDIGPRFRTLWYEIEVG